MAGQGLSEVAFKVWRTMSAYGGLDLRILTEQERKVVEEMLSRGLVELSGGVLRQSPTATVDQWKGLA